ncbi:MAG: TolB family protein [Anaerolineae bacterium]
MTIDVPRNCPFLGLRDDPYTSFLYAHDLHYCYADSRVEAVEMEYQEQYCVGGVFETCPRYVRSIRRQVSPVPSPPRELSVAEEDEFPEDVPAEFSVWRMMIWALVGLVAVFFGLRYGVAIFTPPRPSEVTPQTTVGRSPTATLTATPTSPLAAVATATPLTFVQPTATPTPPPGGSNFVLSPSADAAGWVVSKEERGNHFGDSNIYSGIYDGAIYHGALQFDLSVIPRGAPILAATLQLTGLSRDRLGDDGAWEVRILTDTVDYEWSSMTYQSLHNAVVLQSLLPVLGVDDLGVRKINEFIFNGEQLRLLEQRVLKEGRLSLRIDGPLTGANNLFSWDSGYGPESKGNRPVLFLSVGAPPETPPPREYLVVTNTPTPENVLTAAAIIARMTANATSTGTATPTPRNLVTATPANWIVVTSTPEPANSATAAYMSALATANALTTGTPTPTPYNMVTATPTPTWMIITSVPTPANPATAQARAIATATAAFLYGTATPLPPNWVTPIVVTATPVPENAATAQAIAALATANVLLFGPPTPTPLNVWTATPTPLLDKNAVPNPTPTPEPTATPTPDPNLIPPEMIGRIGFMSDREGGQPWYYVMDADGSNVQRLSGPEIYNAALVRDTLDPTGQYQAIVTLPRNPSRDPEVGINYEISLVRLSDGYTWYIAGGERGADYAPAYCQADPRYIAYTSQQSGNDEIFVVDLLSSHGRNVPLQTTRLTQNDWPWDKHPSWSPDCRQIVFYSNRDGRNQIYVLDFLGMGFLGANERNLSNNPYNDWDPVWFKPPPATP